MVDPNALSSAMQMYQTYLGYSPSQLANTAQNVANGTQAAPQTPAPSANAQLSPNMQLYLQNLSKPSPYTQGLAPMPEYTPPPQFDPTSTYLDTLNKYIERTASWNNDKGMHNTAYWAPIKENFINNMSPDEQLSWLTNEMNTVGQWRYLDLRNQQWNILNNGLERAKSQEAAWKKEQANKPVPLPTPYANSLW